MQFGQRPSAEQSCAMSAMAAHSRRKRDGRAPPRAVSAGLPAGHPPRPIRNGPVRVRRIERERFDGTLDDASRGEWRDGAVRPRTQGTRAGRGGNGRLGRHTFTIMSMSIGLDSDKRPK